MEGMTEKRRVMGRTLAHEALNKVAAFGGEISFIVCVVMYLCKITQKMFRFYFQINQFRLFKQEIFVFVIFKTESEPETEVFVPYIREAEFG